VDDRHVSDGNALGHGQEDVPSSTWAEHSKAQNPCQDVMAQCGLCHQGRALHALIGVRVAQGGPAAALHVGSIGGKDSKAEAVSEAVVELPAFELEGSGERESIQPG
jgi:hypothetical protein